MGAPIEWQATAGGQIDADSHGDVNIGVRSGAWSAILRTDAPELRWEPSGQRGRGWVTVRGHAFAAQMFISPWTDGAPDPTRAMNAASVGAEGGWIRYGPDGLYGGGRVAIDAVIFSARPETTVDLPGTRVVGTVDGLVGYWRPSLSAWARGGLDVASGVSTVPSPHLSGELHWTPDHRVGAVLLAPRVEMWAGAAEGQDDLLRTRLGGLNPWVVPVAGAAWAEWWVEDYAAVRLGPSVGAGEPGARRLGVAVSPFVDLALFDDDAAAGFGLGVRAWRGRLFADVIGGYAPWIPRQDGLSRGSLWVSLGWDWGTAKGPTNPTAPPGPAGTYWP